jgi:hypothetical protein
MKAFLINFLVFVFAAIVYRFLIKRYTCPRCGHLTLRYWSDYCNGGGLGPTGIWEIKECKRHKCYRASRIILDGEKPQDWVISFQSNTFSKTRTDL